MEISNRNAGSSENLYFITGFPYPPRPVNQKKPIWAGLV
jgi:hypothetical protein